MSDTTDLSGSTTDVSGSPVERILTRRRQKAMMFNVVEQKIRDIWLRDSAADIAIAIGCTKETLTYKSICGHDGIYTIWYASDRERLPKNIVFRMFVKRLDIENGYWGKDFNLGKIRGNYIITFHSSNEMVSFPDYTLSEFITMLNECARRVKDSLAVYNASQSAETAEITAV